MFYSSYFLSLDISSPVLRKSDDICLYLSLMNNSSVNRETKCGKYERKDAKKLYVYLLVSVDQVKMLSENSFFPEQNYSLSLLDRASS